jgi:hypothetical protein
MAESCKMSAARGNMADPPKLPAKGAPAEGALSKINVDIPPNLADILDEASKVAIKTGVLSIHSRLLRSWDPETQKWAGGYGHIRALFDLIANELKDRSDFGDLLEDLVPSSVAAIQRSMRWYPFGNLRPFLAPSILEWQIKILDSQSRAPNPPDSSEDREVESDGHLRENGVSKTLSPPISLGKSGSHKRSSRWPSAIDRSHGFPANMERHIAISVVVSRRAPNWHNHPAMWRKHEVLRSICADLDTAMTSDESGLYELPESWRAGTATALHGAKCRGWCDTLELGAKRLITDHIKYSLEMVNKHETKIALGAEPGNQ